jgi:hypothetical protein
MSTVSTGDLRPELPPVYWLPRFVEADVGGGEQPVYAAARLNALPVVPVLARERLALLRSVLERQRSDYVGDLPCVPVSLLPL